MKNSKQAPAGAKRGARKGPGRPPLGGEPINVRLDDELLRRVEKRQKEIARDTKVGTVNRSDVLRSLIVDGLDLSVIEARDVMGDALKAISEVLTAGERAGAGAPPNAADERELEEMLRKAKGRLIVALHKETGR